MRGGVAFGSQGDGSVVGKVLNDDFYHRAYWKELFPRLPILLSDTLTYGAPTGATGDTNLADFNRQLAASYHIKGAGQTILGPFTSAAGYVLGGLDVAASEGVEYLFGQFATAYNPLAMVVADNERPACFIKLEFEVGDEANVGELALGFRKGEAFQANLDDYDELACLNAQYDTTDCFIRTETILNGAATVTAETGLTLAADTRTTFEARIGVDGKPHFYVNGNEVALNFTFDDDEVLVPFLFWLQNASGGSAFRWYAGSAGRLWHERRDPARR